MAGNDDANHVTDVHHRRGFSESRGTLRWVVVCARVIFRSFSTYTLENDSGSDEVLISGGDELQLPREEEDQHVCECVCFTGDVTHRLTSR